MASERRNSAMVCSDESAGRLSNHFAAIISALAPIARPLPSISISTRTNACVDEVMTTAPNRNGLANRIGRSNSAISRTTSFGGMVFPSVQCALGEEVLADALHQFGENG